MVAPNMAPGGTLRNLLKTAYVSCAFPKFPEIELILCGGDPVRRVLASQRRPASFGSRADAEGSFSFMAWKYRAFELTVSVAAISTVEAPCTFTFALHCRSGMSVQKMKWNQAGNETTTLASPIPCVSQGLQVQS